MIKSESLQHADNGAIRCPASEEIIDHEISVAERTPRDFGYGIEKRASQIGVHKAEWHAEHQEQQHDPGDAGLPGCEFAVDTHDGRGQYGPGPGIENFADEDRLGRRIAPRL